MSKAVVLGNGHIHVGLDKHGSVSDFYFPFVGSENHVRSPLVHQIGIWDSGHFTKLSDDKEWDIHVNLAPSSCVAEVKATKKDGTLSYFSRECVCNEKNVYLRKVTITNTGSHDKDVRLFFHQVFGIYGTPGEDTAYYDPTYNALIHYEGRRVFFIYAESSDTPFADYTVGLHMIEGKEGTYKDAEDGQLEKNGIEHGSVDSTLGLSYIIRPQESRDYYYWIAVGESKQEVLDIHSYIKYRTPLKLLESTLHYWEAWVKRNELSFKDLSPRTADLYEKSLFYIRAHIDNQGAIIASCDSDILQNGRDTYSYMWPRDGAMTVLALLRAGENSVSKRFFKFCNDVLEQDGYLMHKYRADRSLGSSWEPFVQGGKKVLPIQEDETALVLVALWKYYEATKEIEFIETHYVEMIRKMALFLVDFIDAETHLPLPSYDLWEEKYGTTTFTSGTVYQALLSASRFSELLGKENDMTLFRQTAEKMQAAIVDHLYREDISMFAKMMTKENGAVHHDLTLDVSSLYGVVHMGILSPLDPRVRTSYETIKRELLNPHGAGGYPRYAKDRYYQTVPGFGNPWFITTLWMAQYEIMAAQSKEELAKVKETFAWVEKLAPESGVLSEQIHAITGAHLSAGPLTWSHAEFINTVLMYTQRYDEIS